MALTPANFSGDAMPTQLRLFSADSAGNLATLEQEVNDWLAAKGDSIEPVDSQTAIANDADHKHAVVIALWYLDPPPRERH
jgi:hypothetical protein